MKKFKERILIAATFAFVTTFCWSVHVKAEPRLRFSSYEQGIIQQNETLRSMIQVDPYLVRHILDALPQHTANPIASNQPKNRESSFEQQPMNAEQRALLEQVKSEVAALNASRRIRTRSPEGSVEYIEMMRRAKAAKDQQTKPNGGR